MSHCHVGLWELSEAVQICFFAVIRVSTAILSAIRHLWGVGGGGVGGEGNGGVGAGEWVGMGWEGRGGEGVRGVTGVLGGECCF